MKKKILSVLLVGAMVTTSLFGCGSSNSESGGEKVGDEKKTIKIMIGSEDSNRQAIYEDYYSKINEEFPDVNIEFELPGTASNYNNKLTVYNSSESLPDIFWGRDIVYQAGNALPLTDLIKEDGFYDQYANPNALIPAPDGEIYCLSCGTDSFFGGPIFYNKDLFEKEGLSLPKSYDEFYNLVVTLKDKGYIPISVTSWAIQNFMFYDLLSAEDPETLGKLEAGEITFEDPAVIEATNKMQELVEAGAFPSDVTSIEQQVHEQLFIDGKAAMIYHPSWVYPAIKDSNFEIGNAYLPEIFGAENVVNAWGSATNGGFMISKDTEDVDLALDIVEWLVMQDADYMSNVAGNVTAIKGFDKLSDNAPDVNKYFYEKALDENTVVYPNFNTNYMDQGQEAEYMTNIDKLVAGQISPKEFGANVDAIMK